MSNSEKKKISISEVKQLCARGYARTTDANNYDSSVGSIEEYYGLPKDQVKLMFTHPALKGVRTLTRKAELFELVEDTITEETVITVNNEDNVENEVTAPFQPVGYQEQFTDSFA
jgi:hypothetical protein